MTVFGGVGGLLLLANLISYFILPADGQFIFNLLPADNKFILNIIPSVTIA